MLKLKCIVVQQSVWLCLQNLVCSLIVTWLFIEDVMITELLKMSACEVVDALKRGEITSSDILLNNWKDKHLSPNQNKTESHVENLLKNVPRDTKILTVIDGHQLTLSWLGSVLGHKVIPLGVDRFGQTGNIKELLTEFAIDSDNISNLGSKLA